MCHAKSCRTDPDLPHISECDSLLDPDPQQIIYVDMNPILIQSSKHRPLLAIGGWSFPRSLRNMIRARVQKCSKLVSFYMPGLELSETE
jgi:hypothetical protein